MSQDPTLLYRLMALSPDNHALFDAAGRMLYASPGLQALWSPVLATASPHLQLSQFESWVESRCERIHIPTPDPHAPRRTAGLACRLDGALLYLKAPPGEMAQTWACQVMSAAAPPLPGAAAAAEADTLLHFRDITRELEIDRLKSEFLATAAHELRTPMASIYGFSDLLSKRRYGAEQTAELAEIIHRQSGNLMTLINNLLDLARIDARGQQDARLAPTPLGVVLDDVLLGLNVGEPVRQWSLDCHDRSALILVDRPRIKKALTQVLINADQYSPAHLPVRVHTRTESREAGPGVVVEILDQGMGMSEQERHRIFERFFRGKPELPIKGHGLGMSLVHEIMSLHAGDVWVQSQPGKGTQVSLWLHMAEPVAAQSTSNAHV
jgi:signal transduction histidine kinase